MLQREPSTPLLHRVTVARMAKRRLSTREAALELVRDWGREGGKKGAKARWAGVSPEQRRAFARKAARSRWAKPKKG
jgi:hypothetical protein